MEKKIVLEENQTIEINGAILNTEILSEILYLQTGNDQQVEPIMDENHGVKSEIESLQRFLNYLASEGLNYQNPDEAVKYMESIFLRMGWFQKFRIPGSKEIQLY